MSDAASLLLSRKRTALGMSQEGAAIQIGTVLSSEAPPRCWVQHIERGPPFPLANHHRLWAYFEVLGIDPAQYLAALGLKMDERIARP